MLIIFFQERRKKERAEEEARMAEARAIEEQKRRAEDVCGFYFYLQTPTLWIYSNLTAHFQSSVGGASS